MSSFGSCDFLLSFNCGCFFAFSFCSWFFVVFAFPYLLHDTCLLAFFTKDSQCPFEWHILRVNAWHLLPYRMCSLSFSCCGLLNEYFAQSDPVVQRQYSLELCYSSLASILFLRQSKFSYLYYTYFYPLCQELFLLNCKKFLTSRLNSSIIYTRIKKYRRNK